MARLMKDADGAAAALTAHRRSAVELLSSVTADTGSARESKPLTIVAA
jgi:hypothetical protein